VKIVYRDGDMFQGAPEHAILAHACNGYGVWGGGIAAQFAQKYPDCNAMYTAICKANGRHGVGKSFIAEGERNVACMITSMGFGGNVDGVEEILVNTDTALDDLFDLVPPGAEIHSPKFNSGLFGVPWELSEYVLEKALETRPDITWVVWTYVPPKLSGWAFPV